MKLDAKTIERFISKIEKTDDCWNWKGVKKDGSYGSFFYKGKDVPAHRFSYEFFTKRTIGFGLVIDHLCRNTKCVNPKHLEPVTNRENVLRGIAPAAKHAAKTHCEHGHILVGKNNKVRSRKGRAWRVCRTCKNLTQQRYMKKKIGREIGPPRVVHT
jgi:hypothetical protein